MSIVPLFIIVYFKYFLCCIVCIYNGALDLIGFILAHVICIFVTHVPPCLYALVGEIKFINLFSISHRFISLLSDYYSVYESAESSLCWWRMNFKCVPRAQFSDIVPNTVKTMNKNKANMQNLNKSRLRVPLILFVTERERNLRCRTNVL